MHRIRLPVAESPTCRFLTAMVVWAAAASAFGQATGQDRQAAGFDMATRLKKYFEQMSVAKPFLVREGEEWVSHRRSMQQFVRACAGLNPLPDRLPLNARMSAPLDHSWCTVRLVSYQLWPDIYSTGLLYMPKHFPKSPAPAVLCPHGHWQDGYAHPVVQTRCLNLARLGYVTFASAQNHYEDLYVGVSHQTHMIWNNMRALDLLQSLPEVDKDRIGVAGASGGGLQAQMIAALDPRVRCATIVGLTCNFRQIMFPDNSHCDCNHFPNIMSRTDHPEISTLGLPTPLQFLTMNDWTRDFEQDSYPTIQQLYTRHDAGDRTFCRYFDTEHNYDQPKRELTYWWLSRWLRADSRTDPAPEPETKTFPVETLTQLKVDQPGDQGLAHLSIIFANQKTSTPPALTDRRQWQTYRAGMTSAIKDLLGLDAALPRQADTVCGESRVDDDLIIQSIGFSSEGPLVVPTWMLRPKNVPVEELSVELMLAPCGKDELLAQTGPSSPRARAGAGKLVLLPDLRTFGESFSTGTQNVTNQARAWQRNGIVWGRPVAGMSVTDLLAVLDGVVELTDASPSQVTIFARDCGDLAMAALFAMALDPRIKSADLDFDNACYQNRSLMLVPNILLHGNVRHWAALAADRKLTIRNLPREAGDPERLALAFQCVGNAAGLTDK